MSEKIKNVPKTRVELHVHLDGSIRRKTIWELYRQKKLKLPGNGTISDLKKALTVRTPIDLGHFLAPFGVILPAVQDDFKALERIAYEFCEDKAKQHVLYVEARYSPHAFLTSSNINNQNLGGVISAIHRGFEKGERDFNIKVRSLLCTLIGNNTARDILKLYQEYSHKGLVGLDIAALFSKANQQDEVPLKTEEALVYQEAKSLGIHRTVHAGERGPAEMVRRAVEVYEAERIGHGYHVVDDKQIYKECLSKKIHFECCPWSSYLTGSVPFKVKKHPIAVFWDDQANFSISTDDPTITDNELTEDYVLTLKWGFTEGVLMTTNFNAVNSCFLRDHEKKLLMNELVKNLRLNQFEWDHHVPKLEM